MRQSLASRLEIERARVILTLAQFPPFKTTVYDVHGHNSSSSTRRPALRAGHPGPLSFTSARDYCVRAKRAVSYPDRHPATFQTRSASISSQALFENFADS